MKSTCFFCIGSINLDSFFEEKKVFGENSSFLGEFLGGSACNTNFFLNKLFQDTHYTIKLVSLLGNDEKAEKIVRILNSKQISTHYIQKVHGNTGTTKIFIQEDGQKKIIRSSSVSESLSIYLRKPGFHTIVSDPKNLFYLKASLKVVESLSKKRDILFACDISGFLNKKEDIFFNLHRELFQNTTLRILILFGNEEEFFQLGKVLQLIPENTSIQELFQQPSSQLKSFVGKMLQSFKAEKIIIKQGEEGATCGYSTDGNIHLIHKKAPKVQVVDSTGAGDAFNAGFIYGLLTNMPLNNILTFANLLGSLNCTHLGAQELNITSEELIAKIDQ